MTDELQAVALRLVRALPSPDRKADLLAGAREVGDAGRVESQGLHVVLGDQFGHLGGHEGLVDHRAIDGRQVAVLNPLVIGRAIAAAAIL